VLLIEKGMLTTAEVSGGAEFGFLLDPAVQINVWDASAETRYMVMPLRPAGTEQLDEAALAALVTRNGLIGVAPV
jgi:nitrile hydratase subunit alpha